jgi:hypothetical protein
MFIRFSLPFTDHASGRPAGIFRGAYAILFQGHLDELEAAWLHDEVDWFSHHLPAPRELDPRAVFWFRFSAGEALTRIWALVRIVETNGVPVRAFRTRRPGTVVYSDPYQVAAVPWRDTFGTPAHSQQ